MSAQAEFEPVQFAFVATGDGPFEVAVGRAGSQGAAVPLDVIASALGNRKPQELPQATVGAAQRNAPQPGSVLDRLVPGKPTVLWAVLLAGVLILGAVAWGLLRQLKAGPPRQ